MLTQLQSSRISKRLKILRFCEKHPILHRILLHNRVINTYRTKLKLCYTRRENVRKFHRKKAVLPYFHPCNFPTEVTQYIQLYILSYREIIRSEMSNVE